jgi:hypothetical protein
MMRVDSDTKEGLQQLQKWLRKKICLWSNSQGTKYYLCHVYMIK